MSFGNELTNLPVEVDYANVPLNIEDFEGVDFTSVPDSSSYLDGHFQEVSTQIVAHSPIPASQSRRTSPLVTVRRRASNRSSKSLLELTVQNSNGRRESALVEWDSAWDAILQQLSPRGQPTMYPSDISLMAPIQGGKSHGEISSTSTTHVLPNPPQGLHPRADPVALNVLSPAVPPYLTGAFQPRTEPIPQGAAQLQAVEAHESILQPQMPAVAPHELHPGMQPVPEAPHPAGLHPAGLTMDSLMNGPLPYRKPLTRVAQGHQRYSYRPPAQKSLPRPATMSRPPLPAALEPFVNLHHVPQKDGRVPDKRGCKDTTIANDFYYSINQLPEFELQYSGKQISYSGNEFEPSLRFTAHHFLEYLQEASKRPDGVRHPILRVQIQPAQCNHRYPRGGHSFKCRFRNCPAPRGTILKGQVRVCIQEFEDEQGDWLNPFHNAGYVHLFCLEREVNLIELFFDPTLRVVPEDRKFEHEPLATTNPRANNPMALNDLERSVMDAWIQEIGAKWEAFMEMHPNVTTRPDFLLGDDEKLFHRLTKAHLDNPSIRNVQRKRKLKAGDKLTNHLDEFVGDVSKQVERQRRMQAQREHGLNANPNVEPEAPAEAPPALDLQPAPKRRRIPGPHASPPEVQEYQPAQHLGPVQHNVPQAPVSYLPEDQCIDYPLVPLMQEDFEGLSRLPYQPPGQPLTEDALEQAPAQPHGLAEDPAVVPRPGSSTALNIDSSSFSQVTGRSGQGVHVPPGTRRVVLSMLKSPGRRSPPALILKSEVRRARRTSRVSKHSGRVSRTSLSSQGLAAALEEFLSKEDAEHSGPNNRIEELE